MRRKVAAGQRSSTITTPGSDFCVPCILFHLIQLGKQHFAGGGPVLVLRPFVLTVDDRSCLKMREANGRLRLVDVLAPCPASPHRVFTDLFVPVDLNIRCLAEVGSNIDCCE